MAEKNDIFEKQISTEYKLDWTRDIEMDPAPKCLSEEIVRFIWKKKNETDWMLEFRLKAYRHWLQLEEPHYWAHLQYPKINYQDIIYYAAPKQKKELASLDEVDPELLKTFEKLGISLEEQKRLSGVQSTIAVDAVIDSVSVKTTFKEVLAE